MQLSTEVCGGENPIKLINHVPKCAKCLSAAAGTWHLCGGVGHSPDARRACSLSLSLYVCAVCNEYFSSGAGDVSAPLQLTAASSQLIIARGRYIIDYPALRTLHCKCVQKGCILFY
jgi:hypothetical protein